MHSMPDIKAYLTAVRDAERQLWMIARKREHYQAMAIRMGGMSEVHVRSSDQHSAVESAAVHLADLEADLDAAEQHYAALVREAEELIQQIPQEPYRMVLTLRYILGHSWRTISDEMDYKDPKSVFRAHGWALKEAQKVLDNK